MELVSITKKARALYPSQSYSSKLTPLQQAYVQGYRDGLQEKAGTSQEFFQELANKLRGLWPSGEKDGKYPWRDSVDNLTTRLKNLWMLRELKDYTLDECLAAARRYLEQFRDNAKYMQTLKYFILKQHSIVQKDGSIKYINESKFADLLEGSLARSMQEEWASAFNSDEIYEQGEVV